MSINSQPRAKGVISMDQFHTTFADLDQDDEEVLTFAVSDEALEASAGPEAGAYSWQFSKDCFEC